MISAVMADITSDSTTARAFAAELGFNINQDFRYAGQSPRIGQPLQHRVNSTLGEDYYTARIDYGIGGVVASRVFSIIMKGGRCGSTYIPKQAHDKKLTVISGCGSLIIGSPEDNDLDGAFMSEFYSLKAGVTNEVTLPNGHFYTIEARGGEVVVSCLSETDVDGNWEPVEIVVEPGEESLVTPEEGLIVVPVEFRNANFS